MMHLKTPQIMCMVACLFVATACPEDVPGDGTQGGAVGDPSAGSSAVGGGVAENTGLGLGGAHDCGTPRVTQDAITEGVSLEGVVVCASCTGSITLTVLDRPPNDGGSADEDPCITTATVEAAGAFSIQVPAGISAVNIQVVDDNDQSNWGQSDGLVKLTASGALGVTLTVGERPVGEAKTSADEVLPPTKSGDERGAPPTEVGTQAPGPELEGQAEAEPTEPVDAPEATAVGEQ
jgi:hypothetical protein